MKIDNKRVQKNTHEEKSLFHFLICDIIIYHSNWRHMKQNEVIDVIGDLLLLLL